MSRARMTSLRGGMAGNGSRTFPLADAPGAAVRSVCAEISCSVWLWRKGAGKEEGEGGRRREGGEKLPSLPW